MLRILDWWSVSRTKNFLCSLFSIETKIIFWFCFSQYMFFIWYWSNLYFFKLFSIRLSNKSELSISRGTGSYESRFTIEVSGSIFIYTSYRSTSPLSFTVLDYCFNFSILLRYFSKFLSILSTKSSKLTFLTWGGS